MVVVVAEQRAQLLDRLLSLKDSSPFILIVDSLVQPGVPLVREFERRASNWTVTRSLSAPKPKTLVIIDDLDSISDLVSTLQSLVRPQVCVLGVFHEDLARPPSYAPQGLRLLEFMSTTVIRTLISEDAADIIAEDPAAPLWYAEKTFNEPQFRISVESRRRSGRIIAATFSFNALTGHAEYEGATHPSSSDPPLKHLTTFNLETTDQQRQDRDQVQLPYLAAQEVGAGGAEGGAIIYQYEKDDDYDEEDPYEDPI